MMGLKQENRARTQLYMFMELTIIRHKSIILYDNLESEINNYIICVAFE